MHFSDLLSWVMNLSLFGSLLQIQSLKIVSASLSPCDLCSTTAPPRRITNAIVSLPTLVGPVNLLLVVLSHFIGSFSLFPWIGFSLWVGNS